MSTLFISHSSQDAAPAEELRQRLHGKKHRSVFLDFDPEDGIRAGTSWERTLYTKLRSCRAVVALCSDNYLASHWCFAEIALARMEGKELFALLIDPWGKTTKLPSILTEDQYIDLRSDPEAGYERLWKGFEVKGIVPEERRQLPAGQCPYPGLRAFDEDDEAIFFGRDDEVREGLELLNRVRRQGHPRLVMVLGSSGSGKSSLARAGIVPRLRRDEQRWLVVGPLRPGRQPAAELALGFALAFKKAGKPRSREEILGRLDAAASGTGGEPVGDVGDAVAEGEPPSAREMLREALLRMEAELTAADSQVVGSVERLKAYLDSSGAEPRSGRGARVADPVRGPLAALADELRLASGFPEARVVLVIDQFEELLGHEDKGENHPANRFLSLLKGAVEAEHDPPLALGTMRSDFLGMLQRSGPLRGVGFRSLSVGPMSEEGMLKVIEQPATLGQIDLEKPELTHRLVRETGTPDALPLLAFTLRTMWDRYHEARRFDVQGYEALGGLQGAIAQVADDTMEAAVAKSLEKDTPASEGGEADRERVRQSLEKDLRIALLSLARPAAEGSGWARQAASWDELPERARPMIRHFVDQRLLVLRAQGTVEVAHEALFRSWDKLHGWLNANAEGLHLRREIRIDAEKWEEADRQTDKEPYLWRGGRLARALELRDRGVLKLKELDTSFVDASHSEEKRQLAEKEAHRRAELEQARKLAEEQKKSAEQALELAAAQARSARRTRIFAAVVGLALVVAVGFLWYAVQQRRAAWDQTRVAVARNWLDLDPTRAALVLLEVDRPDMAAYTVQLMSDALREPLALVEARGHEGEVHSVAFSPRGDRIVTGSTDGTARVWSLDGIPLVVLPKPGEAVMAPVRSVAFSPRGDRIVTGSKDGTARVWSVDGTPLRVMNHAGVTANPEDAVTMPVNSVAFSPEGDRIVTGSQDGTARVWSAGGTSLVALDHRGVVANPGDAVMAQVNSVAFSPDGSLIATAARDKAVRLWDATSGTLLHTLEPRHGETVESIAFAPLALVSASRDNTARVWKLSPDGRPVRTPDGKNVYTQIHHDAEVYDVAISRQGDRVVIVTASDDGTARLWQADGEPVTAADGSRQVVFRHEGEVTSAAFSPAGDRIATASKDGTARVWSVAGGVEPAVLPQEWAWSASFTPDGDVVTSPVQGGFRIWKSEGNTGEPGRRIDLETLPYVTSSELSSAGDRIVTAATNDFKLHTVRLWTVDGTPLAGAAGNALIEIGRGDPVAPSVGFSPRGDCVVTVGQNEEGQGQARVWTADGAPVPRGDGSGAQVVLDHGGAAVTSAAFSPGGERIVTASDDKTARVWNADGTPARGAGSESPQVVLREDDKVLLAVFDPSGELIVTVSGSTARLWRADGGGRLHLPMRHDHNVLTAAFSPSGDRIVTGSSDETARVWSTDGRGHPLVLRGHGKNVRSAAFSPHGDRVVTVAELRDARVWSISHGLLGARIRALTSLCLDPSFREKVLDEDGPEAQRAFERCRRCQQAFRDRVTAVGLEEAFQAYRRCTR